MIPPDLRVMSPPSKLQPLNGYVIRNRTSLRVAGIELGGPFCSDDGQL
jgi:hypothetical protein